MMIQAVVGVYFAQIFFVTGSGLLSTNIVTVIGGANKLTWISSTQAIAAGILGPPISQAADFWGRKWFVVVLTALGAVGGIVASRADTFGQLIAGQGISSFAFGCQPLVHAIVSEIIPRRIRPLAQSAINTAASLGGITGLLAGGALVRNNPNGFRTYFYIATGIYAVAAALICWLYNPPPRELQQSLTTREKLARFDWIGTAIFIPGLLLFSYALTSASGVYPWSDDRIIGPLVVGSVLLVVFLLYEWKFTRTGMLNHKLFSGSRNFGIALCLITVDGLIFFCSNQYFAYGIAVLYSQSLFTAALEYTPAWWTLLVATIAAGIYCSRTKTVRLPMTVAFASFTIFCALMAINNPSTRWYPMAFSPFFGIGVGVALNTLVTVSQLSTPPELIALATGLMIGMRSVGGTIGLSIFQAIFSDTLNKQIPAKVGAAVTPFGFNPEYLPGLIGGLSTGNATLLGSIPGVTPQVIQAGGQAILQAYTLGFRYVWICGMSFACVAVIGKCMD